MNNEITLVAFQNGEPCDNQREAVTKFITEAYLKSNLAINTRAPAPSHTGDELFWIGLNLKANPQKAPAPKAAEDTPVVSEKLLSALMNYKGAELFAHSHYKTGKICQIDITCQGFNLEITDNQRENFTEAIDEILKEKNMPLDAWYLPVFEWEDGDVFISDLIPSPQPDDIEKAKQTPTPPDEGLDALAQEYIFKIHGRGLSTSVGVQTRRLLHDAFIAGYDSALRNTTKVE